MAESVDQHPYSHFGEWLLMCDAGHQIEAPTPNLDRCPAMRPWPSDQAKPCGADIEYRIIPYEPIGGSDG